MAFKYKRALLGLRVLVFILMAPSINGQLRTRGKITQKSHPLLASLFSVAQSAKDQRTPSVIGQRTSTGVSHDIVDGPRKPIDLTPSVSIGTVSASIMCSLCQKQMDLECIRIHCTNDELPPSNNAPIRSSEMSSIWKQPVLPAQKDVVVSKGKPLPVKPILSEPRQTSFKNANPSNSQPVRSSVLLRPAQPGLGMPVNQLKAFGELFNTGKDVVNGPPVTSGVVSFDTRPVHAFPITGVRNEPHSSVEVSPGMINNNQGEFPVTLSKLTPLNTNTATGVPFQELPNSIPLVPTGQQLNVPNFSRENVITQNTENILDSWANSMQPGQQPIVRHTAPIEFVSPNQPTLDSHPTANLPPISLPNAVADPNIVQPVQSNFVFPESNPNIPGPSIVNGNLPLDPISNTRRWNANSEIVNTGTDVRHQDTQIRPNDRGQPMPIIPTSENVISNQGIPPTSLNSDARVPDSGIRGDPLPIDMLSVLLPGEEASAPVRNNNPVIAVNTATQTSSSNNNVVNGGPTIALPTLDSGNNGFPFFNTEATVPISNGQQPPVSIQANDVSPHRVMETLSEFFPDGFVESDNAPAQTSQNQHSVVEVPAAQNVFNAQSDLNLPQGSPTRSENSGVFNNAESGPMVDSSGLGSDSVAFSNVLPADTHAPVFLGNVADRTSGFGDPDLLNIDQGFIQRNPVDLNTLIMSPFDDSGQQQNTPVWNSHFADFGFGAVVPQQTGLSNDITLPGGVPASSIIGQNNRDINQGIESSNGLNIPFNIQGQSNAQLNSLNNNQAIGIHNQHSSFDTPSATDTFRSSETNQVPTMTMAELQQLLMRSEPSPITNSNAQVGGSSVPGAIPLPIGNSVNDNLNVNTGAIDSLPDGSWQFGNTAVETPNGAPGQFIDINSGSAINAGMPQQTPVLEVPVFAFTTPLPTINPIRKRELDNWSKELLGSFITKK
ncbi:hypothetical protein ACF0H5_020034 [Mactra antiquata]